MSFPYAWQPTILDVQLLRIGNVYIAGVPAEFTTMSGRRLRAAIKHKLIEYNVGNENTTVILSGPANGYAVGKTNWCSQRQDSSLIKCYLLAVIRDNIWRISNATLWGRIGNEMTKDRKMSFTLLSCFPPCRLLMGLTRCRPISKCSRNSRQPWRQANPLQTQKNYQTTRQRLLISHLG